MYVLSFIVVNTSLVDVLNLFLCDLWHYLWLVHACKYNNHINVIGIYLLSSYFEIVI